MVPIVGGGGPILSKHSKWGCLSNILRRPYQGKISGDNMSFKQQQITEMTYTNIVVEYPQGHGILLNT